MNGIKHEEARSMHGNCGCYVPVVYQREYTKEEKLEMLEESRKMLKEKLEWIDETITELKKTGKTEKSGKTEKNTKKKDG